MMFNSISVSVMPKTNEKASERVPSSQPMKQQLSTYLPNDQLLSACEYGSLLQVQQAVAEGADVNCLASTGWSPVMLAILHNHNDVVNWLLSFENLDVNYGQTYGTTLHTACWISDNAEVVTRVATKTDNVNALNSNNCTPAQIAIYKGNKRGVLGLLPVPEVDWEIINSQGENLLDTARARGHEEIADLLMRHFTIFDDIKNEAHIINMRDQMKTDNTSFILQIKRHTEIALTTKFKSELSHSFAIKNLYRKPSKHGCDPCKSGLEVVGRNCSLAEAIIETSSVKQEYENGAVGCIEIYFKLKSGHSSQNIANTVEHFENVVNRSYDSVEKPMMTVGLKKVKNQFQPTEDVVSSNFIILPPIKSSLDFIFKHLVLEQPDFVCKLEEAGIYWLSSVFYTLDLADQVDLFGKNAGRNSASKPFSIVEALVKHIAKGGETMVRQREYLITMLIAVDKQENDDQAYGATRIIETLKSHMESSKQLTAWIESVDSKYPLPRKTKWKRNLISFSRNIVLGIGMFMGDVGTDGLFTYSMIILYQQHQEELTSSPCIKIVNEHFEDIGKACQQMHEVSGRVASCLTNLNAASLAVMDCFHKEVHRFSDSNDWYMMFLISLSHMIMPLILCAICGFVLAKRRKQWWKIPDLLPFWAKIRMFYFDLKLNQLMSEQTSPTNEASVKELKEEIEEHQGSVTLALLIEANSESSFQFVFQTLYRLHFLILIWQAANKNEMRNSTLSLFDWRNFSILMSFFTMAFSCFAIRNRSKKSAMSAVHFGLLVSRIILDSVGRLLLFFAWFHTSEDNFSPLMATLFYYLTFLILLCFNILFNTSRIRLTADYILGVILNSWSSVLSYNHYDYSILLGKTEKDEKDLHQSSFIRQILYILLFTLIFIILTVLTVVNLKCQDSPIYIKDTFGDPHEISPWTFYSVLILSWSSHTMACILTIFYYMSHPSRVILNPANKCHVWCLGTMRDLSWFRCLKQGNMSNQFPTDQEFQRKKGDNEGSGDTELKSSFV